MLYRPSANFTRPNNTTAYSNLQLIANNTVAASVVLPSFQLGELHYLERILITKSTTSLTNASVRAIVFNANPTFTNGDGGALAGNFVANIIATFSGTFYLAASDGAHCALQPDSATGSAGAGYFPMLMQGKIWIALQATAGYTPGAQEVFTLYPHFIRASGE